MIDRSFSCHSSKNMSRTLPCGFPIHIRLGVTPQFVDDDLTAKFGIERGIVPGTVMLEFLGVLVLINGFMAQNVFHLRMTGIRKCKKCY